jgi:hypothetical protein
MLDRADGMKNIAAGALSRSHNRVFGIIRHNPFHTGSEDLFWLLNVLGALASVLEVESYQVKEPEAVCSVVFSCQREH